MGRLGHRQVYTFGKPVKIELHAVQALLGTFWGKIPPKAFGINKTLTKRTVSLPPILLEKSQPAEARRNPLVRAEALFVASMPAA